MSSNDSGRGKDEHYGIYAQGKMSLERLVDFCLMIGSNEELIRARQRSSIRCPCVGNDVSMFLSHEGNGPNVNPQPGTASPGDKILATHVEDPYA